MAWPKMTQPAAYLCRGLNWVSPNSYYPPGCRRQLSGTYAESLSVRPSGGHAHSGPIRVLRKACLLRIRAVFLRSPVYLHLALFHCVMTNTRVQMITTWRCRLRTVVCMRSDAHASLQNAQKQPMEGKRIEHLIHAYSTESCLKT